MSVYFWCGSLRQFVLPAPLFIVIHQLLHLVSDHAPHIAWSTCQFASITCYFLPQCHSRVSMYSRLKRSLSEFAKYLSYMSFDFISLMYILDALISLLALLTCYRGIAWVSQDTSSHCIFSLLGRIQVVPCYLWCTMKQSRQYNTFLANRDGNVWAPCSAHPICKVCWALWLAPISIGFALASSLGRPWLTCCDIFIILGNFCCPAFASGCFSLYQASAPEILGTLL